jgi:hypothetical protein
VIASADSNLTTMLTELMVSSFLIGAVLVLMFISMTWIFLTVAISASNTMCGVEKNRFTKCLTVSLLWVLVSVFAAACLSYTARAMSLGGGTTLIMCAFVTFMILAMLLQSFFELNFSRSLVTAVVANVLSFAGCGFLLLIGAATLGMLTHSH